MAITFEIKKHIATLNTYNSGWTKELNLVSWNGNEPKFDIREWNADHTKLSRGLTLTEKEMELVCKAFAEMGKADKPKTEKPKAEPKKKADKPKAKEPKVEKPKAEPKAEPRKYGKRVKNILERLCKENDANYRPALAKALEVGDGTFVTSDTTRMYRLHEPLVDEVGKEEILESLLKVYEQNEKDDTRFAFEFDEADLKSFIKEHGYRANTKKVDPYVFELDGVKIGINPIFLKETIEVMGTNKALVSKNPTAPILFKNGDDSALVCPIRLVA